MSAMGWLRDEWSDDHMIGLGTTSDWILRLFGVWIKLLNMPYLTASTSVAILL
jgi:hypothetical protein